MPLAPAAAHPACTHAAPRRASLLSLIRFAHDVWRQRRALATLDSAALRDLGLESGTAAREARRPIWDLPHH